MLRIFKNFRKQEVVLALFSVVFVVAQVWLELKLPDYMREITSLITTQDSAMHDILIAGGKMLLCAFGSLLVTILVAVCASRIASNFSAIVRGKLFDKVQSFSMEEIGRFSTASLITRSTNDVTQVQMLIVMGLSIMLRAPIMAVMAILKIVDKSWQWTLSTGVAVVVLLVVVIICVSLCMPKFKRLQSLTDEINQVTRENLTGLNVVRAYNAEAYQEEKFEKVNKDLTDTHWFTSKTMAFMMPTIMMIMNGLSLAIYWIGAVLINDAQDMQGKFTLFSDMVVFSSYAMQVVMSFMMLVMIFIMLPRASVAAKRILEVLDTEPSIEDGMRDTFPVMKDGEVEFKDVSFKYPDAEEYVLEHISFSAKKGETIAFIGATGCGKSTAINLIPRFYDVTEGEVLVDGVNVKEYTQEALHNKIGYVSQKAILFSGTIAENVAYGENGKAPATQDDIARAVSVAQASEFIEKKNQGFGGYVAQGGSNFSGGQKQRLSIARAIARQPEILIFDDSFSALDYKTDRILREALHKECRDATKIIVAQRIGTIRDADKIIVLDDGQIAGMGSHDELMKNCEVYQEIAYSQLSKEELA
ncbi:ABC transporter ATP-binding protein [Eubacterium sp. MSJ-33]|uniref:ABC transporter ATP-binding protein n=1 Tax=Eubacterium sp. MSJ-33 TaxID=2841528 RepID=UPI001C74B5E5|nr:ABC transporter ATP-binding protein [Eubacterium sp. MSJ-33]QWT53467.1 ABC transporter ATP-binding protein/permease [Eubacterium sp. MSJ-33]